MTGALRIGRFVVAFACLFIQQLCLAWQPVANGHGEPKLPEALPDPADIDDVLVPRRVDEIAQVHLPPDMRGRISQVAVSPKQNFAALIVRVDDPGPVDHLLVYALEDGAARLLPSLLPADEMPEALEFDDAGERLLVVSAKRNMERTLRVWEIGQQQEVFHENLGHDSGQPIAFSVEGDHLVLPRRQRERLRNSMAFEVGRLADAEPVHSFHIEIDQAMFGAFAQVRLSADATVLVTRQDDRVVGWAQPGEPTLRWRWAGNGTIADVVLLPEARALVMTQDGNLVTLDVATGEVMRQLQLDLPGADPEALRQRPLITEWSLHNAVLTEDGRFTLKGNAGSISVWSTEGLQLLDIQLPFDRPATPHMKRMRGGIFPASERREGPVRILRLVREPS